MAPKLLYWDAAVWARIVLFRMEPCTNHHSEWLSLSLLTCIKKLSSAFVTSFWLTTWAAHKNQDLSDISSDLRTTYLDLDILIRMTVNSYPITKSQLQQQHSCTAT